jgi:hypothetical protein
VVHDGDPLAELVRLLHVVRREQDGLAVLIELAEQVPQGQAALGVQAGRRFVQEEYGGTVEDGPGHHEALGHAAGQRIYRRLRPARELELRQQLVCGTA